MILLAIDTSTSAIAVALHDGVRALAQRSTIDARRHTETVAPSIQAVLAESGLSPADVTDVVVGTGPGPFTGLRVGMVTGTVFAHARGIPVHGVCSLDALAHEAAAAGVGPEFVVVTDARRKEVYWARYAERGGALVRETEPAVLRPAELTDLLGGSPVVGRGAILYPDLLAPAVGPLDVSAVALAQVAALRIASGEAMPVEPLYLRRPDAVPSADRRPALSQTEQARTP